MKLARNRLYGVFFGILVLGLGILLLNFIPTSDNSELQNSQKNSQLIENENRLLCLIAVYLGQKADQNTIQGITGILSCLLGKNEQFTTAKTRGLITSMVNGDILEREREKVISSIKVSFHTISPLGYRILLYTLLTYVIPVDPLAIEWDKTKFQDYADSEEKLIFFIITNRSKSRIPIFYNFSIRIIHRQ